jgi:cysteine desulfurase / selenocysteine lyase
MPLQERLTIEDVRGQIVGVDVQVPLLDGSLRPYVNFDNAASTPALRPVYDKVNELMLWYSSVHRGTGFKSQVASEAYDLARDVIGCFVGANLETNTVLFGRNATEAINKLARRLPLDCDDVILCSLMEHHSNDLPWRQQARLLHIGVRADGSLDEDDYDRLLAEHAGRVKLVAVTGASNVTGFLNPIHRLAEKAHEAGARILVDAAQLAPHRAINIRADDDASHLDFLALSAHKMYAPYGTGALVGPITVFGQGTPELVGGGTVNMVTEDLVQWGGPAKREEAGSPNVVGAVAMAQAALSLQSIGMDALARHEADLTSYALRRLAEIESLKLYGSADPDAVGQRVGVIPFNLDGVDHYKVAAILGFEGGIGVRSGYFCAHPYSTRLLGVSDDDALRHQQEIRDGTRVGLPGLVRISFGCYNTRQEVDHAVEILARIAAGDEAGNYEQDPVSAAYWPRGYELDYQRYFSLRPGLPASRRERRLPGCGA